MAKWWPKPPNARRGRSEWITVSILLAGIVVCLVAVVDSILSGAR